jgi:hypothetical protein
MLPQVPAAAAPAPAPAAAAVLGSLQDLAAGLASWDPMAPEQLNELLEE